MRKSYLSNVAFKVLLPFVFIVLSFAGAKAQTDITIGTGTATNTGTSYPAPLQDYYEGSRMQYMFRASELIAAGMSPGNINAIKFDVTDLNTFTGTIEQMSVKIGTSANNALSLTTWEPITNTVFGPVDYVPVVGIDTITFSSPFFWNGTDNIVLEICNGDPNNVGSVTYTENVSVAQTTGVGFTANHTYRADNLGTLCNSSTTTQSGTETDRPNITFNWTPAAACTGTPNAGTIATTAGTLCFGQPFTITATGVTVASGLAYQWESSPDNVNWSPVTGATALSYTATQTVTTYYRFRVICNGTNTAYSNVLTVTSNPLVVGNYTINNSLPAVPPNFQSFNAAYNYIKCGISGPVTFTVTSTGYTYNEQLIMQAVPGASAANTVTFKGQNQTIAFSSTNTNSRAVIKLDGAAHIIFDSLVIDASAGTYGYGVQLIRNADSNQISNNFIKSSVTSTNATNFGGVVINGTDVGIIAGGNTLCDYNLFYANKIQGGYYSITNVGTNPGGTNGHNLFRKNILTDFYQYGFYFSGTYNSVIDSNVISRPTRSAVGAFYGIYITGSNLSDSVVKNMIKQPFDGAPTTNSAFYGINFDNVQPLAGYENYVINNIVSSSNGNGLAYGISNNSSSNVQFYFNTISIENAISTSTAAARGFSFTTDPGGVAFYDNLISIYRGGSGQKHCIYLTGATASFVCDYNNLFVSGNGTNNYIGSKGTNYPTLLAWKNATQYDLTSVSVDPVYVDTANEYYYPQNAAFDNKGLYLGIDYDIYNVLRNQPPNQPDMGAVEFIPPPCTAPPTAGITVFNSSTLVDTTVCEGTLMPLNLRNNSFGGTQTFDWQTSPTLAGTYTSLSGPLSYPDYTMTATTTVYVRAAVTCGTSVVYSNPLKLTVTPALPGGTYAIGPVGTYTTFNQAKAAMYCGITGSVVFNVAIGSGPYNEQLILDTIPRINSPFDSITFNGNGRTIAYNSAVANEKAVVKLLHSRYVIFDSLVIDARGPAANGFGVQLLSNSDSNIFRKCTILTDTASTSNNYAGIVVNGSATGALTTGNSYCDVNIFDRNTIIGGYAGIISLSNTSTVINNNQFTNNTIKDFYNYGIYLGSGNLGTLVEGNRVTRPTRFNAAGTLYGIYMTGAGSAATTISKNRIYNLLGGNTASTSTTYGINHNSANGSTGNYHFVTNNLLFQFSGSGPVYGIANSGSSFIQYLHNTIAIENLGTFPLGLSRGFSQTGTSTGTLFKNNMVTIAREGTGIKHVIYLSTPADVESDYNNLYIGSTNGTGNYIGFAGSNRVTLADWQSSATTPDLNSLSFDPGYKNPAIEDYSPVVAPLNDKGTPVTPPVTTDINGNFRSTNTPDIGAFEFNVPICGVPAITTATVTPSSNICVGVPIVLDVPGALSAAGLTYVWQNAPSSTGPWVNISDTLYFPKFNTLSLPDSFYRVQIICSGTVYYSSVVHINMNLLLVAGTYTIDGNTPTNYVGLPGANFHSYNDAVAAMNCGIRGSVLFNVAAQTFNEQVFIHKIPGLGIVTASGRNTITFQSASGIASTSILTFSPTLATTNYTLKIDSAKYVTFRNLSIANTSATFGRVVDISGTSGFDTLQNNIITTQSTTSTANTFAAVYSSLVNDLFIKGNTVSNGSAGIYLAGTAANNTTNIIVDSNTVSGGFNYGIFTSFSKRVKVLNNNVTVSSPVNTLSYGVYTADCDTAFRVIKNTVNIANATTGTVNGVYTTNSNSALNDSGIVASNTITAISGNTAKVYGLVNNASSGLYTVNNVIAITSAGNASYGLHSLNSNDVFYYNNSINMVVPGDSLNYAAYFNHTSANSNVKIKNNIFSNKGIGRAFYINNPTYFFGDYNDLFTGGAILAQVATPAAKYATIAQVRKATGWENSSIVFSPAFISDVDLHPNLTNPDVWAIHGRGVQAKDNSYDFNYNPRPITLAAGVPDLGAYEFHPTVAPTVLYGVPLTPAAGQTQTFMYGSDTVMKIDWANGSTVPAAISIKRYSGDAPPQLPRTLDSMYFYTAVDIPGGSATNYKCTVKQFYVDSWQGTIPVERSIAMGRTVPSHAWYISITSKVDVNKNVITDTSLTFLDRFTGLVNPFFIDLPDIDNSNRGKHFWCAYPVNELAATTVSNPSNQQMVIYLSAEQDANVEVRIDGINWVKNYFVPANTVKVSDVIPLTAFVNTAGQSNLGINITSLDNPIVAYTHTTGSASSGAGMLMPVGVWGYEYQTLSIESLWGSDAFTYYYVIADHDNTQVVITSTPGVPLQNTGITPGVPYTVTLNKGEFYQVVAASDNDDLSGSLIKSIPGTDGNCYPVAVFCGSSRAAIGCPPSIGGSGDFIMQQVFPYQAWGKRYITTPTSASSSASALQPNVFRVTVRDPSTIVLRNGTPITSGLVVPGNYYQFVSSTADFIEANKPIMVAQFITDACTGVGDPEMIYISPIEQGIKNIGFYRNTVEAIDANLLTLVVPTNAVASTLGYEGLTQTPVANFWTYTYPHPQNGKPFFRGVNYTVMVKLWPTPLAQQVRISSDSAFTAITYGLGSVESYGYNAGTLVKNLSLIADPGVNHGDSLISSDHTCAGTPYSVSFLLPVSPDSLRIQWSASPAVPNNDVVVISPVPTGIVVVNTDTFYRFVFTDLHTFPAPGAYIIPVQYSHPSFEGCNKTKQDKLVIQVFPEPRADFTVTSPICEGDTTFFKADSTTSNGLLISKWTWKFHDGSTVLNNTSPYKIYPAGTYYDTLKVSTPDGCVGDTAKPVVVTVRPTVDVIQDTIIACYDSSATFIILNPIPGATYNWYDSATGIIPIATGDTFVVIHVTDAATSYYVEAVTGCTSVRKQITALLLPGLPKPIPVVSNIGAADITWTWPAVPGATGYQVQVVGSGVWTDPSSGSTGVTHTVTGLVPQQTVCLLVRVLGASPCLTNVSDTVCGQVGCPAVTLQVTPDTDTVCVNSPVTFTAVSPAGYTFNWYNTATGGTLLSSGASYTFNPSNTTTVYLEAVSGGCTSSRLPVTVTALPILDTPVVTVTTVGSDFVTYSWPVVLGAAGYQYSTTGLPGSYVPVTGVGGLTQTITGLQPLQNQSIFVQALGIRPCQTSNSGQATGTTICTGFAVQVVTDTVRNCVGQSVTMDVLNPQAGYTYNWYNSANTQVAANTSTYSTTVSVTESYFVEAITPAGCVSIKTQVVVEPLTQLAVPTITLIDSTLTTLQFTWTNVNAPGGYVLSINGGPFTVTPSSGTFGLTHLITGLTPGQAQTIQVRALGANPCQDNQTTVITGTTQVCVVIAAPVVTIADSTQSTITFTWAPVANASGYTVTYNSGVVYNGPLTTYILTGLTPGQTASISVVANGSSPCPDSGPGTATGNSKVCVTLAQPVVTVADSTQSSVTFVWTPVAGATGYTVNGTISLPATTTTYVVTGLNPSQTTTISVVANAASPCPNSIAGIGTGSTKGCVALPSPSVVNFADSSSTFATFIWPAVSGATGYKVEVQLGDTAAAWTVLAANQTGTSITVTGLSSNQLVRIRVTTLGALACENSLTTTIGRGRTVLDQVYIPNAFTPNGSGNVENERLRVYSNIVKSGRFLIYSQWGQKLFEANTIADMKLGWDGTFNGKPQPVGVYIFVGRFTLTNGSVIEKKGSINLVR